MPDVRLAIDPGDVHVGWARSLQGVKHVGEWTPMECLERVRKELGMWKREEYVGELIIEEFVLYPGRAKEQGGSSFKTSQLIGALKYEASFWDCATVVMQSATIKNPTRRQLRARGIEQLAVGSGIHAADAELHLYHRELRAKEKKSG